MSELAPWHAKQQGKGRSWVLLHGWGMNHLVWDPVMEYLAKEYHVAAYDLPGHGATPWIDDLTLDELCRQLAQQAPQRAWWLGWSLGGMISLAFAARFPERVAGLILVASTPRFSQGDDWWHAQDMQVLSQFEEQLCHDYKGTIRRFLALQTLNAVGGNETLRHLQRVFAQTPEPHAAALQQGMSWLSKLDLRKELQTIACPVIAIFGERDTLVPVAVKTDIEQLQPTVRSHVIPGAGHAPFLSHPALFNEILAHVMSLSNLEEA